MDEEIRRLVLDILARGRLQQQELTGSLGVRDGGINMRVDSFVNQIKYMLKDNAIDVANIIIGEDVELKPTVDLRDDGEVPDRMGEAINRTKNQQRQKLELYKEDKLTDVFPKSANNI